MDTASRKQVDRENDISFQAEHKLPYILWVCTHGIGGSLS